jgi:hypothetical protein
MANPLDALYFREQFGRLLRRKERGAAQAFLVAPFMESMTDREMANMVLVVQQSLYRTVDYGDVYYVSADMCAMLQELVDLHLKDRTLFHFDQGDIPSLTGFVYFAGHIRLPTMYSPTGTQDLRAILWDQYAVGPMQHGANTVIPGAKREGIYFSGTEGNQEMEVKGKILYTVCDTPNQAQRDMYGPWKTRHWIPAEFGVRLDSDMVNFANTPPGISSPLTPEEEEQDRLDSTAAMLTIFKILTAWCRVIQTEIPVRHETPRDYDKIMVKEGRPPAAVKVTLLRRYSETPPHGFAEVNWAYRWEVKGHYRNQRVGPGRQFIRKVWVKKCVKGPADKPLVVRDSVTALVR